MHAPKTMGILAVAALAAFGCDYGAEEEPVLDEGVGMDDVATAPTEDYGFADYDADRSGVLERGEFDAWWAEEDVFDEWNVDAEPGLTEDEFYRGYYGLWDVDDDDFLTEDEIREGRDRFVVEGVAYDAWADFDEDGDSELDFNEFREWNEPANLYDRFDRDRDLLIDDEELADWFVDLFDVNDDDVVDTTEWETVFSSDWWHVGPETGPEADRGEM